MAYNARPGSDIAAIGAFALVATTANPSGAAATRSPWLAHTRISGGTSTNNAAGFATAVAALPPPPPPGRVLSDLPDWIIGDSCSAEPIGPAELMAILTVACPYSRCGAGSTRPPSDCAINCMP